MQFIIYLSKTAILFFLVLVIVYGLNEKKNLIELFIQGVYDGVKVIWEIFPTLLALLVAVGMLNKSGIIGFVGRILEPFFNFVGINKELVPLVLLRPISGSTTTAVATNIMKENGVDSLIGVIASTIMGATETTIYVVALYTSKIQIKNVKEVVVIGLLADLLGIFLSIFYYKYILSF